MAKAPPSTNFYWNDFTGGTQHMTPAECGCYMRLLAYQWFNGYVPNNVSMLSRICVCPLEEFTQHWKVVSLKFEVVEGDSDKLRQQRIHEDRERAIEDWQFALEKKPKLSRRELSEIRSRAGKKGGRPAGSKKQKSKPKAKLNKSEKGRGKGEEYSVSTFKKNVDYGFSKPVQEQFSRWTAWRAQVTGKLELDAVTLQTVAYEFASAEKAHGAEHVERCVHNAICRDCKSNVPWWNIKTGDPVSDTKSRIEAHRRRLGVTK